MFAQHGLSPSAPNALALDLGCGAGAQSIALAELGFRVVAIDQCQDLIDELRRYDSEAVVETFTANLTDFDTVIDPPANVIVCMGDTLTHLDSPQVVDDLIHRIYTSLEPGGHFVLGYRDLSEARIGTDRFIPIRADDGRIFTCVLEYADTHVQVTDLVYLRNESEAVCLQVAAR